MKKYRAAGAAAIVLMLGATLGATFLYGSAHQQEVKDTYAVPLARAPVETDPLAHIGEGFVVDEGFTSHLPIVILDTGGVDPPVSSYLDVEQKRFIDLEDVEPYVSGTFALIDAPDGESALADTPSITSTMRIKRRGNSSMLYEKAQWMVKLTTESGQDNDIDILGMGAEHEWILNGSMFDKSMLRNYLAYSIASEFMPYTPDNHYCEVLVKNGSTYVYQGVYLLGESIKQGPDRVDIAEYQAGETFNSYLVRRDRLDESATTLETFARLNGYSKEYMALLYPTKSKVSQDMVHYVEQDISAVERVLYSDDPAVFSTYPDVIDVDSFVDYFLLNEFFGSYDAGNYSTYFYKDLGGKLCMGPVWDFDGTMDNYRNEPLNAEKLAFQTKPWFDRLCKDHTFLKKLEKRYIQLRQSSFSERHIIHKIDEIVAHLGGAQMREWARWGHWYTTTNRYSLLDETSEDGTVVHRNATTYTDEIYRIKTALREHGAAIPAALKLQEKSAVITTGASQWVGWMLLLAAAVFFIPAIFVSYRK